MIRKLNENSDRPIWMDDTEVEFDRRVTSNRVYNELKKISSRYGYKCPRWIYWDNGKLDFVLRVADFRKDKHLPDIHISTRNSSLLEYNIELNEPAYVSKEELLEIMNCYENVISMLNDIEYLDLEDLESV